MATIFRVRSAPAGVRDCRQQRARPRIEERGILTSDELISILKGLEEIGKRGAESPAFLEDGEAEDVHHFVEKQLVAIIGETGYKLHSGRSRNEQIATDLRLYIRAAIDELTSDISAWLTVLLERAERAGNSAMPAYTHLQRAEPVLVAHWLWPMWRCFCATRAESQIAGGASTSVRWVPARSPGPRLRSIAAPWLASWNLPALLAIA